MPQPKALTQYKRHLRNAEREIERAVERFANIDPLAGHRVEAVRRIHAVRDEVDNLVRVLEEPTDKG
jgi:hypothetical protein